MPRKQKQFLGEEEETPKENGNVWQPTKMPSFEEANCTWEQYCRRLINKFALTGISKSKQVLALLDAIGEQTYGKVCDLCSPDFPEEKSLDELLDVLSKHFEPKTNKYAERVKFHARVQTVQEGIKNFSLDLKNLSKSCQFPKSWLDEALSTQFIIGVSDERLRLALLTLENLTFTKALE